MSEDEHQPDEGPRYRVDADYEGHAVLSDGTRALLRLLRPDDGPLLKAGFDRLSPESRYRRFLGGKSSLTEADLRYLTHVDGVNHVAVGALLEQGDSSEGLGIARFVRLAEDPEVAEPAIAVIDEYQNRGLGRILLRLLMAAAQERGIRKFRATVLANNVPAQKLLAEADPTGELARQEDGVVAVTVPLPEEPVDLSDLTGTDRPLPLFRMLSLAARGALRLFTK